MIVYLLFPFLTLPYIRCQNFSTSDCSKQKGCILSPVNCNSATTCDKAFTWTVNGPWLEMELLGKQQSPTGFNYIAVGFSTDNGMGDEGVTDCTIDDNNVVQVHIGYNYGKSNNRISNLSISQLSSLIELVSGGIQNGHVYCIIRQRIDPPIFRTDIPPLNVSFYPLLATGRANPDRLHIHETKVSSGSFPYISPVSINLSDVASYSANSNATGISPKTRFLLVRIHGFLMISSWFLLVTTAILFARYFRNAWPDKKPMGILVWFHFHRTLNLLAILFMIIAFLCILASKEWTWSGPTVSDPAFDAGSIHSVTGICCIILAWTQPIGALFRCHPGTAKRPVFNFIHRLVGIVAWILGAVSISIAALNFQVWVNGKWAEALVFSYLFVVAIILIAQEFVSIKNRKKINTVQSSVVEMHVNNEKLNDEPGPPAMTEPKPSTSSSIPSLLLIIFVAVAVLVVFGCGILMILA